MNKEKFNTEIPITHHKKTGIKNKGEVGDNQLPELLELFTAYRKEKKLWN